MTEAEWERCRNPGGMLDYLKGRVTDRKIRLFVSACCRRVWIVLRDEGRRALEATEDFADSLLSRKALYRISNRAHAESQEPAVFQDDRKRVASLAAWCATNASSHSISARSSADYASLAFAFRVEGHEDAHAQAQEKGAQSDLLRDVIGNPFRPASGKPGWRTPLAVNLAVAAYEQRETPSGHLDLARLAVLSDALEETGCTNTAILSHLRSPGPHVRGCWAVDLILGKA